MLNSAPLLSQSVTPDYSEWWRVLSCIIYNVFNHSSSIPDRSTLIGLGFHNSIQLKTSVSHVNVTKSTFSFY